MWHVLSEVGREKRSAPEIGNLSRNLGKRRWSSMVGNGLSVSINRSIWAMSTSMRINLLIGISDCVVESMVRWKRSKDTERHNTLYFANFNQIARVWLKIVCSVLLLAKHIQKLTGKLVDVTRTKALDTSHGPVLYAQERQARDDNVMARMFGMVELQLRIEGRSITDEEMENLADRYPLTKSAAALCRIGPAFLEPLDDNEATGDEAMDDEEDDADDEESNALMVAL
ncbi:hypothetical protein H5410_036055 [Solanum commersonii]|uniref:Uncharacterized protein n=1 Tax=Solanum commersonii TaxID=4109 RepID=A0A9J5Y4K0_SOLCO|nr:hypothetical protein H5410_036055 [Solanum commersonii]